MISYELRRHYCNDIHIFLETYNSFDKAYKAMVENMVDNFYMNPSVWWTITSVNNEAPSDFHFFIYSQGNIKLKNRPSTILEEMGERV
jgi:hypothetical protein